MAGAADSFLNLGWTSFIGRGGETSVSDSEAPDSTMLAALDKTSRGDSGSGISSPLAITITTCSNNRVSNQSRYIWKFRS